MRKLIFTFFMFVALTLNAQFDSAVRFMGIPVDGSKEDMISQLEQKGFIHDKDSNYLEGRFNGERVMIIISTNKDVVDRVLVTYMNPVSETDIKIKFNSLVRQFEKNDKYFSVLEDQHIGEKEDISYEMSINNKRYQAAFHQCYTDEEIDMLKALINDNYDAFMDTISKSTEMKEHGLSFNGTKEENINAIAAFTGMAYMMNNDVWFMISESPIRYNYYTISLFYDNLLNRPNGEDL